MSRTSLKRILTNLASKFVKKSGDTMDGTLSWIGSNDKAFSVKKSLNDTNVDVGWDWDNGDGAGIAFRNSDATNAGQFVLYAREDTTAEHALVGNTNGSLTWDGTSVALLNRSSAWALLGGLDVWTATPTDSTKLIRRDTGDGMNFGQVTFATVWQYIKSKIVTEGRRTNVNRSIASGALDYADIDVSKSGYTPIGIVSFTGSGSGKFTWSDWYFVNSTTARVYFANNTSSSMTLSNVAVTVLYLAN